LVSSKGNYPELGTPIAKKELTLEKQLVPDQLMPAVIIQFV
jgi:hypothetical protein